MYPESKLLYEEFLEIHSRTSPCMTKKLWIETIKKSSIQSLNNWSCHIFRECKFNHQSNRLLGKLASECEVSRVIVYCFSCNGDLVWGTESSCCFLSEWGHRESCSPSNKFSYYLFFTSLWPVYDYWKEIKYNKHPIPTCLMNCALGWKLDSIGEAW